MEVHARGGEIAIVLATIASVIAFVRLRVRRDLWLGSAALTVRLLVEAYLGGLIGDYSSLTVVHFPLGMGLVGPAAWLPVRSRAGIR